MRHLANGVLLAGLAAVGFSAVAEPETLKKEVYLNIMERAVGAYSPDRIEAFFCSVEQKGVYEHGFPRLAANLGVLLAHGRLNEKRDLFVRMMDLCAREMPVAIRRGNKYAGNDFAVREIVCALDEIIRSDALPKDRNGDSPSLRVR